MMLKKTALVIPMAMRLRLADWVRAAQAGADAVTGAMQKSRSGAGFGTEARNPAGISCNKPLFMRVYWLVARGFKHFCI